jgi:murein DD-endopeptidase MepM/ murein hydrolase activator NlpD
LRLKKHKTYKALFLWVGIGLGLGLPVSSSHAKTTHKKLANVTTKHVKTSSRSNAPNKEINFKNIKFKANHPKNTLKQATHYHNRINSHKANLPYIMNEPETIEANDIDQTAPTEAQLTITKKNERVHTLIDSRNSTTVVSDLSSSKTESLGSITSTHGIIDSSFSLAAKEAGLSDDLILQLTNIFAWDIDFATNLDQGDQFTVVYSNTDSNNNSSNQQILAAEFVNQGRILTAIRYKDDEGLVNFYSPEGKPMRKAFLSAPLDYLRISSGFDMNRRHPILNRIRAHKGIDYAARTGTPVKAAGDGEILFCGNKGGYGQVLIIKHDDRHETLYAHLSDFRKDIQVGDLVKQGEVIGYVGQTGLATGPHLHYEFRVAGEHRNPETLNIEKSEALHGEILSTFKDKTRVTLNQLNRTKAQSLLARNQIQINFNSE